MTVTLGPVRVALGLRSAEGRLMFVDGELCAVLTQLDPDPAADGMAGWVMEAAFGSLYCQSAPLFADLGEAEAWLVAAVGRARRLT